MSGNGHRGEPDQPVWGLLIPFVVCTSNGGPYDDESFTAGFQAGRLDAHLRHAAAAGADGVGAMVRTPLLPLLELLGMHHGFPILKTHPVSGGEGYPAMPDWSTVMFQTDRLDPGGPGG